MISPETAGATRSSLAQDWLHALRYWLRGPRGLAALALSALTIGAALNWSWFVELGVAPLLLTVLPCAVMCGLGLCMNKMTGSSCSTSSSAADHPGTPTPKLPRRITAASEPEEQAPVSVTTEAGALPAHSTVGAVEPAPDRQPQVLKRGSDMSKHLKTLLVASTLAAGLAAAPAIYAHDSDGAGGSMTGTIGKHGMMGMMGGMMEHCNEMMQAMDEGYGHRPNEQWRDRQPTPQDHPRLQAPER
jgi:hypothetical protein